MWLIASEPLYKSYSSSIFSRTFCIISLCYIAAIIIPVLVLVAIGYSWTNSSRYLIMPEISYENYQLSCLKSDNTLTYDSSFINQPGTTTSITPTISANAGGGTVYIGIEASQKVFSCSALIYLRAKIKNTQSLVTLPVSFQAKSDTLFPQTINMKGRISLFLSQVIPQSKYTPDKVNSYYKYGKSFTMNDNHLNICQKNITLSYEITEAGYQYATAPTIFKFSSEFTYTSTQFIADNDLLDKIRQFIPYFIYLQVLMVGIIIIPLVRWMLVNRIYTTRYTHFKMKVQ